MNDRADITGVPERLAELKALPPERRPRDPKVHGQHMSIEDCLQCRECRPLCRAGARNLLKQGIIDEKTCVTLENETDSKGIGYSWGNRAERRRAAKGKQGMGGGLPVSFNGSQSTVVAGKRDLEVYEAPAH